MTTKELITNMAVAAKQAARELACLPSARKNRLLLQMAEALQARREYIVSENNKDLSAGREKGLSPALLDRLTISDKVMAAMVQGLLEIAALPDPVGEISRLTRRPNNMLVGRMRIPLGVVAMIYESRPNVTVDASALCLKAGNAVLLRGGSEAIHSNLALAHVLQEAMTALAINPAAVQVVPVTERDAVKVLLGLEEYIDLIIPRGGEGLIRFVAENSRIPVLKHYKGVCHIYVDESADLKMATTIAMNAKVQRPGVCNAMEALLIHEGIASRYLPLIGKELMAAGVELRGCPQTQAVLPSIRAAEPNDWGQEFLDLILAVKVVPNMDAALDHIARYGSQHTESIITNSYANATRFLQEVDASAVMVNASTRLNDGGQFGLGAEIGISTTKLHAYGPMGLNELTSQKFIVYGEGQIRE